MKTRNISGGLARLGCLGVLLLGISPAHADLTATVTPGYVLAPGERPTAATLNLLGNPSITITGTIGGTNSGLAAKSVNGTMFSDNVVDNVTIEFDGSSPRALQVIDGGINVDQINSAIAGAGLGGGGGAPLSNKVDQSTITITNDVLTISNVYPNLIVVASNSVVVGTTNGLGLAMTPVQFATNVFPGMTFTSSGVALNTITAAAKVIDTAHGLGVTPKFVEAVVVCTVADLGYAVGDELDAGHLWDSLAANPIQVFRNSTNVGVIARSPATSGNLWQTANKTNPVSFVALTPASWTLKVYARP